MISFRNGIFKLQATPALKCHVRLNLLRLADIYPAFDNQPYHFLYLNYKIRAEFKILRNNVVCFILCNFNLSSITTDVVLQVLPSSEYI